MSIKIIIPTFKNYEYIRAQYDEMRSATNLDINIIPVCYNASAAENRNIGISKCKLGDIIISVDDDISGFYDGWVDDLCAPVIDGRASLVSARLFRPDGSVNAIQGDTGDMSSDYFKSSGGHVPSAAVAWKHVGVIFDENYQGAGYEDTDFVLTQNKATGLTAWIANKCKLTHKNETKHMNADPTNSIYYAWKQAHSADIGALVFTKDRPAQFDLLMTSIRDQAKQICGAINVIYTCSTPKIKEQYKQLFIKHKNIIAWDTEDATLEDLTKSIIANAYQDFYMMFADDEVVLRPIPWEALYKNFTPDVLCASVRLGPLATFCQPAGKEMKQPPFTDNLGILKWKYEDAEPFFCWGTPQSVIGTIHRTEVLKKYFPMMSFKTPNSMEVAMGIIKQDPRKHMITGGQYQVSIPHNRVSSESNTPTTGCADVNAMYDLGFRIDYSKIFNFPESNSAFPAIPYTYEHKEIGIHANINPGTMNGCQKVVLNTFKGLQKLGIPYAHNVVKKHNGILHTMPDMSIYPRNSVIGPEIMVLVDERVDLWRQYHVWVTPCEWVNDIYRQHPAAAGKEILAWPCGIDVEEFQPVDGPKKWDCLVYYKNVTQQNSKEKLAKIHARLEELGQTYITLEYGQYNEQYFKEMLAQCKYSLWSAGSESQNIALLESQAMGVPTYVLDEVEFVYKWGNPIKTYNFFPVTSAPYFSDECGIKANNMDGLPTFIERVHAGAYNPRAYVVREFNLEKRALEYYELVISR